jgi:malate synthase
LRGVGAAALYNLMEDAATAEISRSQVWQWIHHGVELSGGETVSPKLVRRIADEELTRLGSAGRFAEAREIFERVALHESFVDFLTLPAYDLID